MGEAEIIKRLHEIFKPYFDDLKATIKELDGKQDQLLSSLSMQTTRIALLEAQQCVDKDDRHIWKKEAVRMVFYVVVGVATWLLLKHAGV